MATVLALLAQPAVAAAPASPLMGPAACTAAEAWEVDIRLLGLTAAHATVEFPTGCASAQSVIRARVETTRVIRWLWRVSDTLRTELDGPAGKTRRTDIVDDENGTREERTDLYLDGVVNTHWKTPAGIRRLSTAAPRGALDPLTVLMLLRAHPLPDGHILEVPIFSKDKIYDGTVRVMGRHLREVLGRRQPVIQLRANFSRHGVPSRVFADIFLTDDARRLPALVRAGTRYGHLTGVLTDVRLPTGSP